jgi:hypothetical protein
MKDEWEYRRLLLPDKTSPGGRREWNSGGGARMSIPTRLREMAPSMERRWATALVEDARMKLALDLDPMPTLERGMGLQSRAKRKIDFMVIGGSHAARTAKILIETGYAVCKLINTGWRIDRASCEALASTISTSLNEEDPEVVILQLLDSSIFYTKRSDGSRVLPKKMQDGWFHVEGELVVASADTQFDHYNTLKPVLDKIGNRPCILVSPMPRFITEGCCQDFRHVANRLDRGYKQSMERQLEGVAKKFKNLFYNSGKRLTRVLDTGYNIRQKDDADVWGVDPVHPIEAIYRSIVASILQMAATLKQTEERVESKRRREESQEDILPRSRRFRDEGEPGHGEREGGRGRG